MKSCPLCQAEQSEGLLCHADTSRLERDLGDVASIVADLDITLSRQAKIGSGGKSGKGGAHERFPIGMGAVDPRWVLENVLTTWIRDITGDTWRPALGTHPTQAAAAHLLIEIPAIRRHPAVEELVDEITDAIRLARRTVDRPAEQAFVGPCLAKFEDVTCTEDLYARPWSSHVTCKVCGITHEVADRRQWLLDQAEDRIVTVREAAQWVGMVGQIHVTEDRIRGYIRRGTLGTRSLPDDPIAIRLGDLLDLVAGVDRRVAS